MGLLGNFRRRQETTTVQLRADVVPDFAYSPGSLKFDEDAPGTQVVRFRAERMKNLKILRVTTTQRAFHAELGPTDGEVAVTFDPDIWLGGNETVQLIVETNSVNEPKCRVPLTARGMK